MRRHSIFTRLSLWLGLAPVLAFMVVGIIVILMSRQALRTELVNQINDDMAALVLIDADRGSLALEQAIAQRIAFNTDRAGAPYYRLERGGDVLVGNMDQRVSEFTRPIEVEQAGVGLLVRGTPLRDQRTLVVGRDMIAVARSVQILSAIIAGGALLLALISFGLTRWHIDRLRRRTGQLNDTFDDIARGHLDARISIADGLDSVDELDELGLHINGMLDRLNRLLTLRKRLTDQLAHEIRSPLARLDATLGHAEDGGKTSIETARKDLSHTLVLLDGLLDISALEAQAGDRRNFKPIALGELTAELFDLFEPLAETHDLTLVMSAEETLRVSGDKAQLGRLISNLFDNAIKYATASPIMVSVSRDGDQACLSVSNHGPEITPALQSEIFTPFFRHPDAPMGKGHGLGLALCRSIAARHSGSLTVTSEDGVTTFTLCLPLSD
ncbi:sensor histidine kinase [Algimonas porphyrae]|uniref:histidine kinase n=1 Tax=Algimonas porphyrae TaxID=1128113 RepID=A0ABQ5V114_9PROT|nr:HAMP domain-containing sensor histidine kinase [Algimonas porphyrae]GLQ20657.1 two-component sensor histidine kinase [Algimonas porphyrae]